MCFKRRDRSEKGIQVIELKEKQKEDMPAAQNTASTSAIKHQNRISTPVTALQAPFSTPAIERQNRGLTPVTARQDPFPTPVRERQKPVSTSETTPRRRLGMSPVSRSRLADLKKDRQKVEERIDLEDVIMRIRDGKKQSWESKYQRGKPLTYAEIRDKEIAEAEWRWIFRRNRAFQLGEDYQTNKFLEEYMKDLEARGFDEELRNAQTLVSRPYLYERMKDEKKAAEMRVFEVYSRASKHPTQKMYTQSPMVITVPSATTTAIQSCYPAGKVFSTRTTWQIKQVSFLGDMVIRDAGGAPVFRAVSEWGYLKDLSFVDMRIGRSVANIEEDWRFCAPMTYQIFMDGGHYGSVELDQCCFSTNFFIESRAGPIDIIGDFWSLSYDFVRANQLIAQVRKRAYAFRDTYTVDIEPGEDVVFILACCVIIDKCTTQD